MENDNVRKTSKQGKEARSKKSPPVGTKTLQQQRKKLEATLRVRKGSLDPDRFRETNNKGAKKYRNRTKHRKNVQNATEEVPGDIGAASDSSNDTNLGVEVADKESPKTEVSPKPEGEGISSTRKAEMADTELGGISDSSTQNANKHDITREKPKRRLLETPSAVEGMRETDPVAQKAGRVVTEHASEKMARTKGHTDRTSEGERKVRSTAAASSSSNDLKLNGDQPRLQGEIVRNLNENRVLYAKNRANRLNKKGVGYPETHGAPAVERGPSGDGVSNFVRFVRRTFQDFKEFLGVSPIAGRIPGPTDKSTKVAQSAVFRDIPTDRISQASYFKGVGLVSVSKLSKPINLQKGYTGEVEKRPRFTPHSEVESTRKKRTSRRGLS